MTPDSQFVTADYLRRTAQQLAAIKAASYDSMAMAPGDTVLDAGCGPGIDAAALAQRVGPDGRVIAVDADPKMVAEGERHAMDEGVASRVRFECGSVLALPLPDASVAASRAERLIQVLPPECESQVVRELRRVTRPGGRVVLLDADWGTGSVDCDDGALERRLFAFFAQRMRPNGFAGRRLFRLVREQGLEDVTVESFGRVHHDLGSTPLQWLADTARTDGIINAAEHRAWLDDLRGREARGVLYIQALMVLVTGRVPRG
jgi:ubiquinone/menaquinone biosynthesis C-methylase UbiE